MSRTIVRCGMLVLVHAMAFICGGCGATVYSPAHPIDPAAIYVADYGRHSSIFFPMGNAAYVEYSLGDWNFYALGHNSNLSGVGALFFSESATLARRYARSAPGSAEPAHLFQPRIFQVCVASSDMKRVRDGLERRWRCLAGSKIYNPAEDTEFVRDPIHYSWLYTCNDWTAQLLRETGCRVVGLTTFSAFHSGDKPAE